MLTEAALHPRFLLPRLTEALADTPVVLIHGPRQCGKTTLARQVGDAAGYAYISWEEEPVVFHHFRDKDGTEVDVVMERGEQQMVGIEIKAAATVTTADFKGLCKLKETVVDRFVAGVVLYDGESVASFGDGMLAVPISMLWELQEINKEHGALL